MRILIFSEHRQDKTEAAVRAVYPNFIHNALADVLKDGNTVKTVTLDNENCGITQEVLDETDVLFWWGHIAHHEVPDAVAELVRDAVLTGMGLVVLHSGHMAKPFKLLMGTACSLRWREGSRERLWVTSPGHPIAQGVPEQFELEQEEMYGEYFDIPTPEDIVFMGWFAGGEVFRSGVTFRRGLGKIFYFQPGHESNPTFRHPVIQTILRNAAAWAAPTRRGNILSCSNPAPLEFGAE